jgi:hypothetical protein
MARAEAGVIAFSTTVIVAGIVLTFLVGLDRGFDATSALIFLLIVAVGALGIAVARRSRSGDVAPTRCRHCGGLMSPSAPYCKHCGAQT